MDGIELEISVPVLKYYVNDHEVVDMIQVHAKALLGDIRMDVANDQVPGRAYANLVGNMTWQDEVTVIPDEFELHHNT